MIRARDGSQSNHLGQTLQANWTQQECDGFLLSDLNSADIHTRHVVDGRCGISYRFRWIPHREIRGNVAELERRGILNSARNEGVLFRDSRDPLARHCFLCADNIRECHPLERLLPLELAGRGYFAGANFAWIEPDHYTVMAAEHQDQEYSRHVLEAMLDLHSQTDRRFRVLFNGLGAGASIPWHLHYQITTASMPIEDLPPGSEADYPTLVQRIPAAAGGLEWAHHTVGDWLARDPEHHSVNLLVTTPDDATLIFVFPRHRRQAGSAHKGLVGGFEVAGDFCLSAPPEQATFHNADAALARSILSDIKPQATRA